MKEALVLGAGGFIGSHLVRRLKREGMRVRGVDLKFPPYATTEADDFVVGDLRDPVVCRDVVDRLVCTERLPAASYRRVDVGDAEGVARALRELLVGVVEVSA